MLKLLMKLMTTTQLNDIEVTGGHRWWHRRQFTVVFSPIILSNPPPSCSPPPGRWPNDVTPPHVYSCNQCHLAVGVSSFAAKTNWNTNNKHEMMESMDDFCSRKSIRAHATNETHSYSQWGRGKWQQRTGWRLFHNGLLFDWPAVALLFLLNPPFKVPPFPAPSAPGRPATPPPQPRFPRPHNLVTGSEPMTRKTIANKG